MADTGTVGILRAIFTAETAEFESGVRKVAGASEQVGTSMQSMGTKAQAGFNVLAGAFASAQIGARINEAVEATGRIADSAQRLGVSAEAVQRLGFAAEQGGSSLNAVATAFTRMSSVLSDPKGGAKALDAVGLSFKDIEGLTMDQTFIKITNAIRDMPDGIAKTDAALDLLGRSSGELMPAIKAGFDEVGAAAPVMSNAVVESGEKSGDALEAMKLKMDNLTAQALLPLVNAFTTLLPEGMQVAAAGVYTFIPSLETLALGIIAAGGPTAAMAGLATIGGSIATLFLTTLPAAFTAILPFLGPIGWIAAGVTAVFVVWKNWDTIADIVQRVYTAVKTWLVDKFAAVVRMIGEKVGQVTGFFKSMYDAVVGNSYVPDMVRRIGQEFTKLDPIMSRPTAVATTHVEEMFDGMMTAISGKLTDWLGSVGTILGSALTGLVNTFSANLSARISSMSGAAAAGATGAGAAGAAGSAGLGAGLLSGALTAGIGTAIAVGVPALIGLFRGNEEEREVNPARDRFIAAYGGDTALGERILRGVMGTGRSYENAEDTRRDLMDRMLYAADTMAEFTAAVQAIQSVPGFARGTGGLMDFGTGQLAMLHGREAVVTESDLARTGAADHRMEDLVERRLPKLIGRAVADALTLSPRLRTQ